MAIFKKKEKWPKGQTKHDQKLNMVKYAAINGTAAAICAFKKEMPEVILKENTGSRQK